MEKKKPFSKLASLTVGAVASAGLVLMPASVAKAETPDHGDHGCSGKEGDHSCSGKEGDHSCSGEKGDHNCSGEKGDHDCSGKEGDHDCSSEK